MKRVGVVFRPAGRAYDFACGLDDIAVGDRVVVEMENAHRVGRVVRVSDPGPDEEAEAGRGRPLLEVVRRVNDRDDQVIRGNLDRVREAAAECRALIREHRLGMKLISQEYLHSGNKMIFYFTAENRVDFRELVRELARRLRLRVELRQVGVRDETKLLGGLAQCGRELCCATFLTHFRPVSIKMAKVQGLSLNPQKVSGSCGRLMCCLSYEQDQYSGILEGLPDQGKKVRLDDGEGRVGEVNIFKGMLRVDYQGGGQVRLPFSRFRETDPRDQEDRDWTIRPVAEESPDLIDSSPLFADRRRRPAPARPAPAGRGPTPEPDRPEEAAEEPETRPEPPLPEAGPEHGEGDNDRQE